MSESKNPAFDLETPKPKQPLNPTDYLRDLIETIPNHPVTRLEDLLPHRWEPNPDLPRWINWQPYDQPTEENFIYWEKGARKSGNGVR